MAENVQDGGAAPAGIASTSGPSDMSSCPGGRAENVPPRAAFCCATTRRTASGKCSGALTGQNRETKGAGFSRASAAIRRAVGNACAPVFLACLQLAKSSPRRSLLLRRPSKDRFRCARQQCSGLPPDEPQAFTHRALEVRISADAAYFVVTPAPRGVLPRNDRRSMLFRLPNSKFSPRTLRGATQRQPSAPRPTAASRSDSAEHADSDVSFVSASSETTLVERTDDDFAALLRARDGNVQRLLWIVRPNRASSSPRSGTCADRGA
jgi:hypothetical protein